MIKCGVSVDREALKILFDRLEDVGGQQALESAIKEGEAN